MNTRKLILYIATSLDGYIATKEGDISWLSMVEVAGEDYGYQKFVDSIDTVIMGRKTYDKVLSFGIEFPHKDKTCYVLSNSKQGKDENITFYSGSLPELLLNLKKQPGKDIYCDGGAETVLELLKANLIDQFVISVIPVILGDGIRLFQAFESEKIRLELMEAITFQSGLVQLRYKRK